MRLFKWSAGLALTCMLVACGGGGGNPGSSGGGTGGGGTGGTGGTTQTLSLSALTATSTSLPSGGETAVSVTARLGTAATSVNISFSASCGRINGMTGSVGTTSASNGLATVTYTAVQANGSPCSGPVSVTASAAGATSSILTITVAAPTPNQVTFVSAVPEQIFLAGTGAQDQSTVRFRVLSSGTAVGGANVVVSIVSNPGGVGLNLARTLTTVNATTDPSGEVVVPVFSGSIPGPVRIRAALVSNAAVFAESQNLTVASGPPSQRFMSLSADRFKLEGANRDGEKAILTVRIADRQGNAVDDGTVVNFTAEGGQVARSCATTRTNNISACSVDFVSQNPRPTNGRVSVLAYLNGTKDYVDVNANNRFDTGIDTLANIGDAYRDDNENNIFDTGEFVLPRGGTGACVGTGGSFPSRANTCDPSLVTTVRQQAVFFFLSSFASVTPLNGTASAGAFTFTLSGRSVVGVPPLAMPDGTVITVVGIRGSGLAGTCTVSGITGSPVMSNGSASPTSHSVTLAGCAANDIARLTFRTPLGEQSSVDVTLR